ncbi:DUF6504 family protein [Planctomycetota bacterium]
MNQFVSETITPVFSDGPSQPHVPGEPILPQGFRWRDTEYTIETVVKVWKENGPCRSGASELYLRKHWYQLRMTDGCEMEVYFERQARSAKQQKKRWWLYTLTKPESSTA